jgi:hypothetical protein
MVVRSGERAHRRAASRWRHRRACTSKSLSLMHVDQWIMKWGLGFGELIDMLVLLLRESRVAVDQRWTADIDLGCLLAQVGAESEGLGFDRFKICSKFDDCVAFGLWAKLKLSYGPIWI